MGRVHPLPGPRDGQGHGPQKFAGGLVLLHRRGDRLHPGQPDDLVDERARLPDHDWRQAHVQPSQRLPALLRIDHPARFLRGAPGDAVPQPAAPVASPPPPTRPVRPGHPRPVFHRDRNRRPEIFRVGTPRAAGILRQQAHRSGGGIMRYVLLGFALAGAMILAIAGLRYDDGGRISRRPPIELFPDMDRQPKLRPQAHNNLFADQFSSRLPVEGTVARTRPFVVEGREIYPFEDNALNTGRIPGTTNFVETIPLPLTEQRLARGRQRYTINCSPCHGAAGDGKGITSRYQMIAMANFHDPPLVKMPDGETFTTITSA